MASIAHFMTEKKNFQAINSNNELKIYLQQGYHFDYLTKRKKNLNLNHKNMIVEMI